MNQPPSNNTENSGEIYGGNPVESAYQSATEIEGGQNQPTVPFQPEASAAGADIGSSGVQSSDTGMMAPPPFAENNKKKFFVVGLFGVIFLLIVFLLISFISSRLRKGSTGSSSITLQYWGLWEEKNLIQPIIDEYQKSHPGITINYSRQDPIDYGLRLQKAIDRGEGPDIFRFHNTWVPAFRNELAAMPKTVYSDDEYKKIFYPIAEKDMKLGSSYYGIPLTIDGLLLFYNEDILNSANVKPPKLWDDMVKSARKITVREGARIATAGVALGNAENIEHFSDILGLLMLQNGTAPLTSLDACFQDGKRTATTACGVEALSFYWQFAVSPNQTWDETFDNSILAFAGGKVGMIFAPSWQIFTIKTINPNLKFSVANVPQLPGIEGNQPPRVEMGTYWAEGVSAKSKNQAAAWEFLKYLSQPETLQKLYELQMKSRGLFGEAYPRQDMKDLLKDNPYLSPIVDAAPYMQSFPASSRTRDGDGQFNSVLIQYLKNAVNSLAKDTSPETALNTANQGFHQVYQRYGLETASSASP